MNSLDPTRPLYASGQLPTSADMSVSSLDQESAKCQEYCHSDPSKRDSEQPATKNSLFVQLLKGGTAHKQSAAIAASSQCSSWLASLVYPLGRYLLVPAYFSQVEVIGRSNLPRTGPVILAPTHRSRWDAMMIPYAAGHDITGNHPRFMVSADEVRGLQGWFIRRLGGFPIDPKRPAIASLRHGVDLLQDGETLVIFPEGNIFRDTPVQRLKPGLARLALQAESSRPKLGIQIVPIHIHYSDPSVPWRCKVRVCIGQPIQVSAYNAKAPKQSAQLLTADLKQAIDAL